MTTEEQYHKLVNLIIDLHEKVNEIDVRQLQRAKQVDEMIESLQSNPVLKQMLGQFGIAL